VPNILVEILSPTTQRKDRTEKKAIYEHNGVDEYWIVDPPHRSVTVFHLGPTGYAAGRTFAHGMLRSCVLPGLQAEVEAFFRI
jgi:Uma2 family endonuclease